MRSNRLGEPKTATIVLTFATSIFTSGAAIPVG